MSSRVKTGSPQQAARAAARRGVRPADWVGKLQRESVENAVSALINLLDAMDASLEDREADEDCCAAGEDDLGRQSSDCRAGDPLDGEPDEGTAIRGETAGGLAEACETWIGRRVDGKGRPVVVRRRRVIAVD